MNILKLIPLLVLVALAAPGAQAQQMPNTQEMHKRFGQMDRKMEDARKSHGGARRQHMHEHMQMMHTQMQAMHGMMGGGQGDGQMGRGGHGPGGQMGPGGKMGPGGQAMQHMQTRMDMMQKMMEQMQKQHELMIGRDSKKN